MISIRSASNDDLPVLVEIHEHAFMGFTLTLLGKRFLMLLYRAFLELPDGVLLVAYNSALEPHQSLPIDKVLGFVAGSSQPERLFGLMRRSHGLAFGLAAVPALLRSPGAVAERIISALRYRGDPATNLPGYWLLSSLAVMNQVAGRGIGENLVTTFCELAEKRGAPGVYLTTDAKDNDRTRAFYARNGFTVRAETTRRNGRTMILYARELKRDSI